LAASSDNKKAKSVTTRAALSDRVQVSINNCLPYVSANFLIRGVKSDERWKALLFKQEEKTVIKKTRGSRH
jgi:hypothetical protein